MWRICGLTPWKKADRHKYVYIHTNVFVCMCVYIYIYVCVCTYVYIYIYIYTHAYVLNYICRICRHTHVSTTSLFFRLRVRKSSEKLAPKN